MLYDVVIIGAGPAGISASLYAKRSNLNVLVLYSGESNLEKASKVENYYGFSEGITGKELYSNGINQAKNIGVELKQAEVVGIENLERTFSIKTQTDNVESKAVIISTGNRKLKPDIPGILEFEGKGISYCAICDAFFYRNKNIAIIGSGNFAISEANKLKDIVNNVTILSNGDEITECNYEVNTSKIREIKGNTKVEKIEFEDGSILEIDGVFIALGEAGASDFAKTLGILQDGDNIKVNEKMETNVKGIFACGNITGGLLQICKAVYEGAEAGITAIEYVKNW